MFRLFSVHLRDVGHEKFSLTAKFERRLLAIRIRCYLSCLIWGIRLSWEVLTTSYNEIALVWKEDMCVDGAKCRNIS